MLNADVKQVQEVALQLSQFQLADLMDKLLKVRKSNIGSPDARAVARYEGMIARAAALLQAARELNVDGELPNDSPVSGSNTA